MKIILLTLRSFLFLSVLLLTACSTLINNVQVHTLTTNYCAPNVAYRSIPIQEITASDSIQLRKIFSYHDFVLIRYLNLAEPIIQYLGTANNATL